MSEGALDGAVDDEKAALLLLGDHLQGRIGRPKIDRRRLKRHDDEVGDLDRGAEVEIGFRRRVDDHDVVAAGQLARFAARAPSARRAELETGFALAHRCLATLEPGAEAALRIDVENGDRLPGAD